MYLTYLTDINMNNLIIFLLFATLAWSCKGQIVYKNCKNTSPVGKINSIGVSDCTKIPCQVHKGNNYTVTVNFTTSKQADNAFADVHGIVAGILNFLFFSVSFYMCY